MSGSSFRVATEWENNCSAKIVNQLTNLHGLHINVGPSKVSLLSNYETAGLLA